MWRSVQVAWLFKATTLHAIRKEIEAVEHDLWDELEAVNPIEEFFALENWMTDLGSMWKKHSLYDRTISMFWAMKGIMVRVLLEMEENQRGDECQSSIGKNTMLTQG